MGLGYYCEMRAHRTGVVVYITLGAAVGLVCMQFVASGLEPSNVSLSCSHSLNACDSSPASSTAPQLGASLVLVLVWVGPSNSSTPTLKNFTPPRPHPSPAILQTIPAITLRSHPPGVLRTLGPLHFRTQPTRWSGLRNMLHGPGLAKACSAPTAAGAGAISRTM